MFIYSARPRSRFVFSSAGTSAAHESQFDALPGIHKDA